MNKKKEIRNLVLMVLLLLNITVTVIIGYHVFFPKTEQYVLYIGTNDKDTYQQMISTEEAKQIVNKICAKNVDGYTVMEAEGGWIDEKNVLTEENTLVYTFNGVKEEQMTQIMDEVLEALNQNSILLEKRKLYSTYYSGAR